MTDAPENPTTPDSPPLDSNALAAFATAASAVASIPSDEGRERAIRALNELLAPNEPPDDTYERLVPIITAITDAYVAYMKGPSPCPCRGGGVIDHGYPQSAPFPSAPSGAGGSTFDPPSGMPISITSTLNLNPDQVVAIHAVLTPEQLTRLADLGLHL